MAPLRKRFVVAVCSTGALGAVFNVFTVPPKSVAFTVALALLVLNVVGVVYAVRSDS